MTEINRFRDLMAHSRQTGRPSGAHLELTFRCNLDCSFCYNEKIFGGELTTAEIFRTLESLANLGALTLNLSGGEPLVRRDLRDIIARGVELGFSVKVYTNGVLIDEQWAEWLGKAGIFGMEISVHGDDAQSMDRVTGVPGSFSRLLEALGRLQRHGVHVLLKTPVTRHNVDRLDGIKAIADRFDMTWFTDAKITPRDDGDTSPITEDGMTVEQAQRFWRDIAPRLGASAMNIPKPRELTYAPGEPICGTGSAHVVIDPFGNVLPCVAWRKPLGNVRERPLEEIWLYGPEARGVRQQARDAVDTVYSNPAGDFAFLCLARVNQAADPKSEIEKAFSEAAVKKQAYEKLVAAGGAAIDPHDPRYLEALERAKEA